MKVPRFLINLIRIKVMKDNGKIVRDFVLDDKYPRLQDVNYMEDGNFFHCLDVIYPPKDVKRKNICVIDLHGGAYIFGDRKQNLHFGTQFANEGFDYLALDYEPVRKKRTVRNIVNELSQGLEYIVNHLKELGLENDRFVITGDSAGGHLALIISEMVDDKELSINIVKKPLNIKFIATLLNCPVYDFVNLGNDVLTNGAQKRLIGSDYNNVANKTLIDSLTHLPSLTTPLFLSTCKYDFLRSESLKLNEDMKNKIHTYKFIDLDVDDKTVGHVHNVVNPLHPQSVYINKEMIKFIEELI